MRQFTRKPGFSMLEIIVVVTIILVLTGITAVSFANSNPSMRVKRDAAKTVSFLRTMWDRARVSGSSLVLQPDFEKGELVYIDPLTGEAKKAEFEKNVRIVGIQLNDRLYNEFSNLGRIPTSDDEEYAYDPDADVIYVSEGRGLVKVAVVFATYDDDPDAENPWSNITISALNLINGKSRILRLEEDAMDQVLSDDPMELYDVEEDRDAQPDFDDD